MQAEDSIKNLFAQRSFVRFWLARLGGVTANQMLMVALAWHMYDITSSAWDLGLVGLFQFVPALVFTLPAGHLADKVHRGRIFAACMFAQAVAAGVLLVGLVGGFANRDLILLISVVLGIARAFQMPAQQAITPQLVPIILLQRALTLSASAMQTAIILGPALGGVLYVGGPGLVYGSSAGLLLLAGALALQAATIAGFYRFCMRTRFILIQTSHAGNVGAAARAMKTMGFDDLVLVAPRWANVLRRDETIQRASGALDVLEKCRIVDTLDEALDGMTHLCATAMTPRDFGPPTTTPREHFAQLVAGMRLTVAAPGSADGVGTATAESTGGALAALPAAQTGVAFLFGSERFGMRNEDVYRCHACLSIPSNPQFGSLNIGAALQVIAYDWRLALGGFADAPPLPHSAGTVADAAQVSGMLAHLEQALVALAFLDPAAPKKLIPRLNAMFNRAAVTQEEIHILRGIAKSILQLPGAKDAALQATKPGASAVPSAAHAAPQERSV